MKLKLLGSGCWQGIPAQTDEEAMAIFDTNTIKLVLLGSGIEQQSEINLFINFDY